MKTFSSSLFSTFLSWSRSALFIVTFLIKYYNVQETSPCHLVLSTRRVLATVLTILLQCFLSVVTSLSSASFIPVTSCISSIHFLLGRPLLLPSPNASIILFSSPSDRITCPKNPSSLLSAVCCSVSSSIPISMCTLSLVFISLQETYRS